MGPLFRKMYLQCICAARPFGVSYIKGPPVLCQTGESFVLSKSISEM
jgi:hypothetical protein